MTGALARLAAAAGVARRVRDAFGAVRTVSPETLRAVLAALGLPAENAGDIAASLAMLRRPTPLPPLITTEIGQPAEIPRQAGRYRLHDEAGSSTEGVLTPAAHGSLGPVITAPGYYRLETASGETMLAVAPRRCFDISDLVGRARRFGLAVQVNSLRRVGDGGIGDVTALAQFARAAAGHGADAVAISPVHAPMSGDFRHFSPYSPSSRVWLNWLFADPMLPGLMPKLALPVHLAGERAALESLALIDWPRAARARLETLRFAYAALRAAGQSASDRLAAFRRRAGESLEHHARFEALAAHFRTQSPARHHWREWPPPYRDPASPEVAAFAASHAEEVTFHAFLQFLTDAGLGAAQQAARDAGMAIGLISDLAVGTDPAGSQAWSRQREMLSGLTIGAPPDPLGPAGQDWGLAAFSPAALAAHGYAGFLEIVRTALRHAGGVRIDHVLGLRRLWVIPAGAAATEGTYLAYPETDLLRLIALESWRARAIVLGEDLGTVPRGLRARLRRAGILGLAVMLFERDEAGFTPPRHWRREAAAMTSTHDLPTIAGWWRERDIDWREKLGLFAPPEVARARAGRAAARCALWQAFRASGAASGAEPAPGEGAVVADAAAAHLGAAASRLALLPVEDALALTEQPNLPGTIDVHANWRRRLATPADEVLAEPAIGRRLAALAARREAR